ncbi:MAG: hypothetical protein JW844_03725 [Candidatus Omnitrophica bacterium]|nr:hypothetical protein [Candidatus Omnitrophota bacterium]
MDYAPAVAHREDRSVERIIFGGIIFGYTLLFCLWRHYVWFIYARGSLRHIPGLALLSYVCSTLPALTYFLISAGIVPWSREVKAGLFRLTAAFLITTTVYFWAIELVPLMATNPELFEEALLLFAYCFLFGSGSVIILEAFFLVMLGYSKTDVPFFQPLHPVIHHPERPRAVSILALFIILDGIFFLYVASLQVAYTLFSYAMLSSRAIRQAAIGLIYIVGAIGILKRNRWLAVLVGGLMTIIVLRVGLFVLLFTRYAHTDKTGQSLLVTALFEIALWCTCVVCFSRPHIRKWLWQKQPSSP